MLAFFPRPISATSFDRLWREIDRALVPSTAATDATRGSQDAQSMHSVPVTVRSRAIGCDGYPGVNIWRDGDRVHLEAELPGFRMDEIELMVTEVGVTLRGERSVSAPEGATPLCIERNVRRFERGFRLPIRIEPAAVTATLTDGVLRVTMPVAQDVRPRRIEIHGGATPAVAGEACDPQG